MDVLAILIDLDVELLPRTEKEFRIPPEAIAVGTLDRLEGLHGGLLDTHSGHERAFRESFVGDLLVELESDVGGRETDIRSSDQDVVDMGFGMVSVEIERHVADGVFGVAEAAFEGAILDNVRDSYVDVVDNVLSVTD